MSRFRKHIAALLVMGRNLLRPLVQSIERQLTARQDEKSPGRVCFS